MGKPESIVEKYLFRQVIQRGGKCLKFTSGVRGVPDRVVILNGHTLFVEAKALGETTRKLQDIRIAEMRTSGARVEVADTRELIDALIDELMSHEGTTRTHTPCPHSSFVPPALRDADGYCAEHGWDCED